MKAKSLMVGIVVCIYGILLSACSSGAGDRLETTLTSATLSAGDHGSSTRGSSGATQGSSEATSGATSGATTIATSDSSGEITGGGPKFDLGQDLGSGQGCYPDVLLMLDRSMSMAWDPAGNEPPSGQCMDNRWHIALPVIEDLILQYDDLIRFGLGLFPRVDDSITCADSCTCLATCTGTGTEAEIAVEIGPQTGAAINAVLDVDSTELCRGTPVSAAAALASSAITAAAQPEQDQYIIWFADGGAGGDPNPGQAVQIIGILADTGITTFVLGFAATLLPEHRALLNNLACAGEASIDFPTGCEQDPGGVYVASDPQGPILFFEASDALSLQTAFDLIIGQIPCLEG